MLKINDPSPVTWFDDGSSCYYINGSSTVLNDTPTSSFYFNGSVTFQSKAPVTLAPTIKALPGTNIDVPVLVRNFKEIGKLNLNLHFDTTVLNCNSWTNNSGFTDWSITEFVKGEISFTGKVDSGLSGLNLPDSSRLFTLHCRYFNGSTGLIWKINDGSCAYMGQPPDYPLLIDTPKELFYFNGAVLPFLEVDDPGSNTHDLRFCTNSLNQSGTLYWYAPFPGNYSIIIYDMRGRIMRSICNMISTAGYQRLEIPLNQLSPGIYHLILQLKGGEMTVSNSVKFANY